MIEKVVSASIKNKIQPYHWHDTLELIFAIRGEMVLKLNNRVDYMSAGTISVINRDDVHCIESVSDDLLYIQLSMNIIEFEQYIPGISTIYFNCNTKDKNIIDENLKAEIKNFIVYITELFIDDKKPDNYEQTVIYYCVEILNNLKMGFNFVGEKVNNAQSQEKFDLLWNAIDYMYDNCNRKLTVKDVATNIFVSETYLTRLIKQYMGASYGELLAHIRAELSLKYLLNSDLSITNIAYECGFSAPRYYYSAFEKIYGCSPMKYRENNRDFFMLERSVQSLHIIYDDINDKDEVINLIQSYKLFTVDSTVHRIQLTIDLSKGINCNDEFICRSNFILCSEDDFFRMSVMNELQQCKADLGISKIKLVNSKNKEKIYDSLICAGFDVENALDNDNIDCCNCFKLKDLFGKYGEKSPEYYLWKAFHEIEKPYMKFGKNCIVYSKNEEIIIMVFNVNTPKLFLNIGIKGLEPGRDYLRRIYTMPNLSNEMKSLLTSSNHSIINKNTAEKITAPIEKYDIFKAGNALIMDIDLERKHVFKISLKPFKFFRLESMMV